MKKPKQFWNRLKISLAFILYLNIKQLRQSTKILITFNVDLTNIKLNGLKNIPIYLIKA